MTTTSLRPYPHPRLRLAALLACMPLLLPSARADDSQRTLTPCRIPGVAHELRCGVVQRPLDAGQEGGPQVDIHYAVLPAVARRKLPDAVFLLAGGPGQSAIDLAPQVLPWFNRLNQRRDVVLVDQRGTGRSAPLQCGQDKPEGALADWAGGADEGQSLREARRCLQKLQALPWVRRPADIAQFTTPQAMQDLDAVRQALGLGPINLVGASYGTRAALDYQRQFPGAVRRMVLDGVAPPDVPLYRSAAADTQRALDALWSACGAQPDCRRAYGDLRRDWPAWLRTLPRDTTVLDPLTGQPRRVTLTREMALAAVRGPLYAPALAAGLPHAVHAAIHGRLEPLAGLYSAVTPRHGPQIFMGMHFSVTCAEDVARPAGAPLAPPPPEQAAGEFGDDSARRYEAICAMWPRAAVPADFYRVPPSRSPVLLLSGGADPVTPPGHGARAQAALGARAVHVVVPEAGHGVLGVGCMRDVLFRFIDAMDDDAALKVDTQCAQRIPRPAAFVPPGTPPDGSGAGKGTGATP